MPALILGAASGRERAAFGRLLADLARHLDRLPAAEIAAIGRAVAELAVRPPRTPEEAAQRVDRLGVDPDAYQTWLWHGRTAPTDTEAPDEVNRSASANR